MRQPGDVVPLGKAIHELVLVFIDTGSKSLVMPIYSVLVALLMMYA